MARFYTYGPPVPVLPDLNCGDTWNNWNDHAENSRFTMESAELLLNVTGRQMADPAGIVGDHGSQFDELAEHKFPVPFDLPGDFTHFEMIVNYNLLGGTQDQRVTITLQDPDLGTSSILFTKIASVDGVGEKWSDDQIAIPAGFEANQGESVTRVLELKSTKQSPRGSGTTGAPGYWDGIMCIALYGYKVC